MMFSRRFVPIVVSLTAGAAIAIVQSPAAAQCELHETQKLIASDGGASDNFGNNVAISGNTLVVGAGNRDCAMGPDCGSAYVFRLNGANWVQEAELIPSDLAPGDLFGGDFFGGGVAVDGDRIVVGAAYSDPNGVSAAGAAYIFRFNGTAWVQEAKLTASDAAEFDHFGHSVAVLGDRAFVGAQNSFGHDGAVYVYRRQGTNWMLETTLRPPGLCGNGFGIEVSVHANRILVGSFEPCLSNVASPTGGAYVFRRKGTNWIYEATLPRPPASIELYAGKVALSDNVAVLGFKYNGSPGGGAAVCRRSGTTWSFEAILSSPVGFATYFPVATDGNVVVLGNVHSPASHVFIHDGKNWPEVAQLTATDTSSGDALGSAVSISGDRVLLGAPGDDNAGGVNAGSAYVFDLPHDCNANGVGDACDIASGNSQDLDDNGYPDECCLTVASPVADPDAVAKNRYITLVPGNPGCSTALRVTLTSLHHLDPPTSPLSPPPDFFSSQGQVRWVGPPSDFPESSSDFRTFKAARLQCSPHYMDWSVVGLLHVYGDGIVPSSLYNVQAVAIACPVEAYYSLPPLSVTTARWADVALPYQQTCADSGCSPCTAVDCVSQPDALDIVSLVNKFKDLDGAPSKVETQLQPNAPDPLDDLNALDIVVAVDAFKGMSYYYSGPTACPP